VTISYIIFQYFNLTTNVVFSADRELV